ncbi:MAG: putative lipid II flippase FtsW [Alphaproteobacteria bacterium]
MQSTFSRTDRSLLGQWWWTVDKWMLAGISGLMFIGILMSFAASPSVAHHLHLSTFFFAFRHLMYLVPTILIMLTFSMMSPRQIRRFAVLLFLITFCLIIATLFMGSEIKGARRWVSFAGFSIQPSEFIKPAFAVVVAWMLAENKTNPDFPGRMISMGLFAAVVSVLLLQPDLGMTVLITAIWFGQFFISGLALYWVFLVIILGVGGLALAYLFLPHVTRRIDQFMSGSGGDRFSDRYQITQSLEAFMNGGFMGQGPGEGTVKKYLPDAHADFVFAVVGEEFGVIVCLLILGLFLFVVLRSILKLYKEEDLFIVIAGSGLIIGFALQALINMASTLGIIPTKGMTLPFISYGGSSMMALAVTVGMILGLTRRRFE